MEGRETDKRREIGCPTDDGLFPVALKGLLLPFHSRGHLVSAAFCFTPVRICRLHTITKKLNALMLRLRNLYSSASKTKEQPSHLPAVDSLKYIKLYQNWILSQLAVALS
ncbi:hypothetical protein NC651_020082 [Populus alba x Populus x berolinensis]|nr:hypothetical protein NC651_020082 [Populus alba x Populus x berolinensis]